MDAYIPITLTIDTQQQHENYSDASTQTNLDIFVNEDAAIETSEQQETDEIFVPEQHDSDIFVNTDGTIDEKENQQSENVGGFTHNVR